MDAYFTDDEYSRIAVILRGAFQITTSEGDEDELLGDFIAALDDGISIHREDRK